MTIKLSTGVRNAIAQGYGLASLFNRGSIGIYSGSPPTNPDAAVTGTLLGTVTAASGALTQETAPSGTITLTGGAAGSVNSITVAGFNIIPDGAVPFNASLNQTASDLCDAINRNGYFRATVAGAVVTIKPRPGSGAALNASTIAGTLTTITATYVALASGVTPANGLIFGQPALGVLDKLPTQTWSFLGIAAGTAGWFRLIGSEADAGALLSGAPWLPRIDGLIAVSGADLSLSNPVIAVGAPTTIDQCKFTMPS